MKLLALCLSMIEKAEDKHKFDQLYWAYKDLVHYCAMDKLHNEYLAEEAVSLTFEHIAKNMYKIGEAISPSTKRLIVTIAERTAINMYKKQQNEMSRIVNIEEIEPYMLGEYREDDKAVTKAILKLPQHYRQPILLKYSLGYSTEETAAILNYSVAKTRKLITRGKKKLGQILQEEEAML